MTTDASDRLSHGMAGTDDRRLPPPAGRRSAVGRMAALAAFVRASGSDADTVARTAVELLRCALGASRVELLGEPDAAGKVTVQACARDAGRPWVEVPVDPADRAFVELALAASEPLVVARVQKDARFVPSERIRALGATSAVAAPVRAAARAFGVLCVYRGRRFSGAEVDFVATFAGVVAVETERARLRGRLEARTQDTRRLGELIGLVTENLPVALAYCDADTVYRWANSRHAERHGLTPEQIIGRRVPDLWGEPVYSGMIAPHITRVLAGESVTYERPIRLHDGSIRESTVHLTPAIGRDGQVEGFASLTLDITERRRVERALEGAEVSRRFLASIVEQSLDCILTRNVDDVITSWNPGAARLLGWTAQEAIGKRSRDLHLRYMSGVRYEHMLDRIRKGEPAQFEVTWHTRDADQRYVLSTFAPMHDDAGRHIGEIVIARDVSELHEARAALENLNNELERRVDERTSQLASAHKEAESLSYSIAHDLRAPLRAISGYTRILTQEIGPQFGRESRDYLDRVAANAERMGTLIDALLSFGHLARQPLARSLVDLNEAAGDALGWLAAEQTDRSLQIELGELGTAQADPALIRVVLANLLSNALKFTRGRDPAHIEVGRMAGDGEWIYFVRDNGAGFDMRYVDKLFGVFQRLHGVKEFEGSGVGLASVQRIAQRHGGRVWAQGEVDRGATFYFTLGRA